MPFGLYLVLFQNKYDKCVILVFEKMGKHVSH